MNWPTAALGDIFEIARGGSPRPIDEYFTDAPDGLNWVLISDAIEGSKYIRSTKKRIKSDGATRSRMVKPGDFLLTNSMSFGRPYVMATSGCIHDGWLVLSPKTEAIVPDYFYHLLGSPRVYSEFERLAAGATVKNLNIDLVRGVKVPVPSVAQQCRIAAILDQADALRRTRSHSLDRLHDMAEGIFTDLFGNLQPNAENWPRAKLGDLSEVVSGITKGRKPDAHTRLVPYMAVVNVQDKALNLEVIKTIEATESEIARYRLRKDDLLLTEGGDPDKLGRGTLWQEELVEAIHQNHIFRVRIISDQIDPLFLNWLIGSPYGKAYFLRSAKQTTGIASINMTQLRAFPLLLPPIELQTEFRRRLDHQRKLVAAAKLHKAKLDQLFTSLQQHAFSGELTSGASATEMRKLANAV